MVGSHELPASFPLSPELDDAEDHADKSAFGNIAGVMRVGVAGSRMLLPCLGPVGMMTRGLDRSRLAKKKWLKDTRVGCSLLR